MIFFSSSFKGTVDFSGSDSNFWPIRIRVLRKKFWSGSGKKPGSETLCPFKVKMKLSVFNRVSFKHQDTDIFIALTYPDQWSKWMRIQIRNIDVRWDFIFSIWNRKKYIIAQEFLYFIWSRGKLKIKYWKKSNIHTGNSRTWF